MDGEGVINAAANVDIDGIIDILGGEADEDVGGGAWPQPLLDAL